MWRQKWINSTVDSEAYDIARGLYDSKVNIKRPPTAAQQGVYTASSRGPPVQAVKGIKPRPHSAKARITSDTSAATVPKTRPPWRPFSGHAALNRGTPFAATAIKGAKDSSAAAQEEAFHSDLRPLPTVYQDRCLTNSLMFLREWLTESVPGEWPACYDPKHSFVFLPCVESGDCGTLPCVPPVQQPEDLLIYNPVPQPKKYKPPKPRFRSFFEDEDSTQKRSDRVNVNTKLSQASAHDSSSIHEIYEGKRTADIIKQEIEDLERLLQGIGNPRGSSLVVRYQHDINHLRDMVKTTLEGYEFSSEDSPRCLTPVAACFQEDMVKYPEQHEQIFKTIKQRRDQCVRELADIEREIMTENA